MVNEEYTEIRCPGTRNHTVKGIEYTICGQLLGGLKTSPLTKAIFRCPICKTFWEVDVDEQSVIEIEHVNTSKQSKIEFKKQWRIVHGE